MSRQAEETTPPPPPMEATNTPETPPTTRNVRTLKPPNVGPTLTKLYVISALHGFSDACAKLSTYAASCQMPAAAAAPARATGETRTLPGQTRGRAQQRSYSASLVPFLLRTSATLTPRTLRAQPRVRDGDVRHRLRRRQRFLRHGQLRPGTRFSSLFLLFSSFILFLLTFHLLFSLIYHAFLLVSPRLFAQSIAEFLFNPLLGSMSDRFGRKAFLMAWPPVCQFSLFPPLFPVCFLCVFRVLSVCSFVCSSCVLSHENAFVRSSFGQINTISRLMVVVYPSKSVVLGQQILVKMLEYTFEKAIAGAVLLTSLSLSFRSHFFSQLFSQMFHFSQRA